MRRNTMHRFSCAAVLFVAVQATAYSEREIWVRDGWDISPTITEACSGDSLWSECADHTEARSLLRNPNVLRDNAGIAITLTNGRVLRFDDRDDVSDGSGVGYHYLGLVDRLPYHVLMESWSEAHTYWMVHSASGWTMKIEAFPAASPDGQRVAAARIDEFGDTVNRLVIWAADRDTLRLEAAFDMHATRHPDPRVTSWAIARPRWATPHRILAAVLDRSGGALSWRDARAIFSLRDGHWVMVGEGK